MAEIDSLDIKISASAEKANNAINKLIQNIGRLSTSLNFNTGSLEKIANVKGLENISKSAQNVENQLKTIVDSTEKILSNVDSSSKSASKSMESINNTAKRVSKSLSQITEQYKDLGKGYTIKGNATQIQKEIDKLYNAYARAKLKKDDLETIGKINTSQYENAVKDTIKWSNAIESLKNQLESLNNQEIMPKFSPEFKAKLASESKSVEQSGEGLSKFTKRLSDFKKDIESTGKGTDLSNIARGLEISLESLKSEFPAATKEILDYKNTITQLKETISETPFVKYENVDFGVFEKGSQKANEFKTVLNSLKSITPQINETNIDKLQNKLKSTEEQTERLRYELEKGLRLGTIDVNDKNFEKLTIKIKESENQAELLREKIKEVGNESKTTSIGYSSLSNSLKKISSNARSTANSINGLTKNLSRSLSGIKSFTRQILSAVGIMGGLYGAIRAGISAIDIASQLTEVQNVVDVTFGNMAYKIEDFAQTSIQQFGMSELTLKQVSSRFQAMGTAMGFPIDQMSDMSVELTKLTADMASFYNVEQADVSKSLESIFTGTTRPLRQYGLDLTQATLQEWALKNGLDANISSMSQAEKTMLRYQYVLANTGAAQGDFARTSNTWANQVRILKMNFQQLASIIGGTLINALKPLVKSLNTAMTYIIKFAKVVSDALGKIFGWTYEEGGGFTQDFEDAEDAAGGIADSTGEAAKNAKKLKQQLQGFDELNVLTSDYDTGVAGAGGGLSGGVTDTDGGQWKQGESILKSFESELDTLYKLGRYIGDKLSDAMESINWDSVYEKAKNFGSGLASFLNGLISPRLFGNVGKTIASSLNTALNFLNSFGTTFDWKNFGESIASGINNFFETFDFKGLANTINVWIKGALTTVSTLLKKTDFEKIGNKIGEFLKELDFLEIAGDLAEAIWEAIKSAFELLKEMFKEAPLETSLITAFGILKFTGLGSFVGGKIGGAITDYITNNPEKLISGTIKLAGIGVTLASVKLAIDSIGETTFSNTAISTIGTGLGTYMITGSPRLSILAAVATFGFKVGNALYENFDTVQKMSDSLVELIGGLITDEISLSEVANAAFDLGFDINTKIADFFLPDGTKTDWENVPNLPKLIFNSIFGDNETKEETNKNTLTIFMNLKSNIDNFKKDIETKWNNLKENAKKTFSNIKSTITSKWDEVKTSTSETWEKIKTNIGEKWDNIKKKFSDVKTFFETAFNNAYIAITNAFSPIVGWFEEKWNNVRDKFSNVKTFFEGKFKDAYIAITTAFSGIGAWASETWGKITSVFDKEKVKKWFKGAFDKGYEGVKEAFNKIDSFFKGIANKIAEPIKKALEAVRKGLNWILDKIGAKQISGEIDMPTAFAKGSDGIPKNTVGVVNDQKGSTYKELILPPNGKPFIPEGRNVMMPLKKGTKIMPASQTKTFMDNAKKLPHFKSGIGDFFGNLWGNIKKFTGNIFDYFDKPKEILQIAFSKFVDTSNLTSTIGDIASGALKTIVNNGTDYIKKIFEDSGNIKYDPSKGVTQWKGVAKKALSITKQYSENNLAYLLNQMQHESGGNPKAINNWDINAKLGHPSKGLMQVIDPTFKSYALSPYNKNIFDPLSNMIASIRYTVSRYGSLYAGWAARGYQGYAAGGFPEDGWFRASKNELIGQWDNGQSAVVTNYQITEGISDAVQKGNQENNMLMRQEISILQRQNDLLMGILEKETGISYRDVFEATRRGDSEYKMINGQSAFLY